jgi:hypothetical protein
MTRELDRKHKKFWKELIETIILLLVFYGCETWFLTLREEHRLRVFEMRNGVVGGWKELHNGAL